MTIQLQQFQESASTNAAGAHLAAKVRDVLRSSSYVLPDAVDVEVREHAVYLSGTVDWEHQRVAAERAVEGLPGVHVLRNGIHVRPRVEPSTVKTNVLAALPAEDGGNGAEISVDVDDESVTLTGTVSSYLAFQAAQKAALATPHVRTVRNSLRILRT